MTSSCLWWAALFWCFHTINEFLQFDQGKLENLNTSHIVTSFFQSISEKKQSSPKSSMCLWKNNGQRVNGTSLLCHTDSWILHWVFIKKCILSQFVCLTANRTSCLTKNKIRSQKEPFLHICQYSFGKPVPSSYFTAQSWGYSGCPLSSLFLVTQVKSVAWTLQCWVCIEL